MIQYEYRCKPPSWGAQRREQYLLRPEIVQPLGIDKSVWPSGTSDDTLVAIRAFDPRAFTEGAGTETLEPGFATLGFDVADSGWTSGLSNCGYWPAEVAQLRALWRGRLNDHGLLVSYEAAEEFRASCDKRVPEHAPFFVFELLTKAQPR